MNSYFNNVCNIVVAVVVETIGKGQILRCFTRSLYFLFILCCIVLCCLVLCCIVLCFVVLCCIVLYCVVLYCIMLCCEIQIDKFVYQSRLYNIVVTVKGGATNLKVGGSIDWKVKGGGSIQ